MNKLVFTALSLLCCFSNNINAAKEITSADIFASRMMQFTLAGCGGGPEEQLKLLENNLLPDARKEQDRRCPNLRQRLMSQQPDAECEQAKKQVIAFTLLQTTLKEDIRFDAEYRRCGQDEACQERVRFDAAKMAAELQKGLFLGKDVSGMGSVK